MGRLPHARRQYQISHMWEIHQEILRRLVAGQKPRQIASELQVTTAMISYIRNSNICRQRMAQLNEERDFSVSQVAKQIAELAPRALEVLEEALENPDSPINTRVKVAESLLDRAGFAPVQKVQGTMSHTHFTAEEIEDIKRRAYENSVGMIVETESKVIEEIKCLPQS
jgi:hypothetical protein